MNKKKNLFVCQIGRKFTKKTWITRCLCTYRLGLSFFNVGINNPLSFRSLSIVHCLVLLLLLFTFEPTYWFSILLSTPFQMCPLNSTKNSCFLLKKPISPILSSKVHLSLVHFFVFRVLPRLIGLRHPWHSPKFLSDLHILYVLAFLEIHGSIPLT